MEKNILILVGIVAAVILVIAVVYMNNQSQASLAKYSVFNNALIAKNTELQTKAGTKDWLAAGTSIVGSAASIYNSMGSGKS